MNFSFNATAGTSQSSSKPQLEGNQICKVKFVGTEIVDIQGKADPTQIYKVIKLKFENENGAFEHTVFEPKEDDFKRGENEITTKEGKKEKIPQASNVESMMLLFKHAIDSINPKIAKEIDDNTKSLSAPSWDALRILVSKILDMGKGTEVSIKLMKNKKGEATFPGFFAGLTKPDAVTGESKAYIRNNFIGNKLAFSAYEKTRISKEATAVPTKVDTFSTAPITSGNSEATTATDFDFEIPKL